jgi:hypothetical protein
MRLSAALAAAAPTLSANQATTTARPRPSAPDAVKAFGQHVDQEPAELVRVEHRRLVPATGSTQSPKTYSTVA